MNVCPKSSDGKHCDCVDALYTGVCCYCRQPIRVVEDFDDDGSEENNDA